MSQDRTAPLPPGIVTGPAWGEPLPGSYAQAAAPFRPLFARIREHAAARETERSLPYEALEWLREARLTAAR
ncbi:MAG: monooxygenase, partial [Paraburkholderia tropica]